MKGKIVQEMLKKIYLPFILLALLVVIFAFTYRPENRFSILQEQTEVEIPNTVSEILLKLGGEKPYHYIAEANSDSVEMGRQMVFNGLLDDGSNNRISKFFQCTDCHNQVLESANPANESPSAVLEYSMKNEIPYLPASTFYGMYNKEHWYNGDYDKKYGDLVKPTRDTLQNAIQLCATQCAQGRPLEKWEIRCILHYMKANELKKSDIILSKSDKDELKRLLAISNEKALKYIKSKYNQVNPATFGNYHEYPMVEGYSAQPEKGEYIYKMGCMHCHAPGKNITNFDLSDDILSYKFLEKRLHDENHFSVPYITRKGTYAFSGRKQYMPQYSMEKMSDEQLLDLIEFIKIKANE